MGLILCPDCKQQISDRADHCIHCGCPIDHDMAEEFENWCLIDGVLYDFTSIIDRVYSPSPIVRESMVILHDKIAAIVHSKMSSKQISSLLNYIIQNKCVPDTWESGYVPPKASAQSLLPQCPHCHSGRIQRISTTKRVVGVATFGLASSSIGKTMECKNCGYKW